MCRKACRRKSHLVTVPSEVLDQYLHVYRSVFVTAKYALGGTSTLVVVHLRSSQNVSLIGSMASPERFSPQKTSRIGYLHIKRKHGAPDDPLFAVSTSEVPRK